jgi:hypothetical protein
MLKGPGTGIASLPSENDQPDRHGSLFRPVADE